jgi:phage repressor protein C with HTH and peptisase S24 domain
MMLNALQRPADDTDMNLSGNLQALMAARGLSEGALSRLTQVPQPTIHRILKGRSADPRDGTLRPIASVFRITVEELRSDKTDAVLAKAARRVAEPLRAYDIRAVDGELDYDESTEVLIDEVDLLVSGGPGAWVPEFIETKFRMPYQLNWFRQVGAKPENVKIMKVHGHSMERTLFDGDRIAINLADKRIADGHVYVFISGGPEGGVKVKRLYTTADGRVRVVSDNPDKSQYPDEYLGLADMDGVYIVGRVIDKSGRGGL